MSLPGDRDSLVLVTGRQGLASLSIIDSAYRLTLDLPTPKDAREGLLRRICVHLSANTVAADADAVAVAADQIVDYGITDLPGGSISGERSRDRGAGVVCDPGSIPPV